MADLAAHGVTVTTPPGWEGRIFVRPAHGDLGLSSADGAPAPVGELTLPLVQLATIALPEGTADYGDPAVEDLGPHDALIVLKEFDPSEASTPLFANDGVPRGLDPETFDSATLQRTLTGQAGYQIFCREGGRAFCLYVVLGAGVNRDEVVPYVNAVLMSLHIDPIAPSPTTTTPTTTAPLSSVIDAIRSSPDLTTLAELVAQSGVDAELAGPDSITVFAPTDAAFTALADLDAIRGDAARAGPLVRYHVIPAALDAGAIGEPQNEVTLEGHDLTLRSTGTTLVVNDVETSRTIAASNGFVHVLGVVLTPPAA